MKTKKLTALITSVTVSMLMLTPGVVSFAEGINHHTNGVVQNQGVNNNVATTSKKDGSTNTNNKKVSTDTRVNANKTTEKVEPKKTNKVESTKVTKGEVGNEGTAQVLAAAKQSPNIIKKINIFTGKVVKTTNKEKEAEAKSFAVTYSNYAPASIYNGDNLQPLTGQNTFASSTNEALYNSMLNPNNRWAAEKEAMTLHNGDAGNDCAFFVSSALRGIGVGIPDSTMNCWTLQDNLSNMGWTQQTNFNNLLPGDICFAGTDGDAHTFIFMGWSNKADGIAWIADSQFGRYGNNYHPRDLNSNYWCDPTEFYYTAPGGQVTVNTNTSQVVNPEYAPYGMGVTNVPGLNVRTEPNTNSQIITSLPEGTVVVVTHYGDTWDTINYNGQTAYVYAPYVTQNGKTPSSYVNGTEIGVYQGKQYPSIGSGTISFPSVGYTDVTKDATWYSNVVGTVQDGVNVTITGYNDGWFRINYQDGSAWVPASRINTDLKGPKYTTVANGTVNFAGGTDIQEHTTWYSNTLGYIPDGSSVQITGEFNGWYRVNYLDTSGFIPVNRVDNPNSYNATLLNETGIINFSCGYTDAKAIPSWYGYSTYTINNGTKVHVTGSYGGWYRVEANGKTMWVPEARVEFAPNVKVLGTGKVSFPSVGYTDVTSKATWYSNVTGTVNDGATVKIIGSEGNWYNIILPNGVSTAWIPQSRLVTSIDSNYVSTGNLNQYTDIMAEGTWYSNCLGTVNQGTPLNIINEVNGWYEVAYNGSTGWIPVSRVTTNYNANKSAIAQGIVEFSGLSYTDVMTNSTWYSELAGTLNNGTQVEIVAQANGWDEINYGNTTAWIPQSRVQTGTVKKVNFNLGFSDITSEPTWYSNVQAVLPNGTPVVVKSNESNGWSSITYGNNKTGYIMTNRLQ